VKNIFIFFNLLLRWAVVSFLQPLKSGYKRRLF